MSDLCKKYLRREKTAGCLATEKGDAAALGGGAENIYLAAWTKGACVFHVDQMWTKARIAHLGLL